MSEVEIDTLPHNTALLVIDVQVGLDHGSHGHRNNPYAEENIARLLAVWRETGRPIVHVQHLSTQPESQLRPGQPGVEIKDIVRPQGKEPVLQKHVNSAFIGTDLEERLRSSDIACLVITGLTSDHCVSATTRMASDLGFRSYLVGDATAAHERRGPDGILYSAEEVHAVSLASLHREFATVVDTDSVLRMVEHGYSPEEE